MRLTPCFRKRLLKVGMWILPVALVSTILLSGSPGAAMKYLLAWLAAYLFMCVTWWLITQVRRAKKAS